MLTSKQRARLAGLAAGLDPIVILGRAGASEGLGKALDEALSLHELVKLRFGDWKGERKELARALAATAGADLVRVIGNVAVLFRRNPDPSKRVILFEGELTVRESAPRPLRGIVEGGERKARSRREGVEGAPRTKRVVKPGSGKYARDGLRGSGGRKSSGPKTSGRRTATY